MREIIAQLRAALAGGASEVTIRVLDPDRGRGLYAGETLEIDGVTHVHRPLAAWLALAQRLELRLCTPRPASPPLVELRFERLDPGARWHDAAVDDPTEKYGAGSAFARIDKREDPGFVLDLEEALARVAPAAGARVLDLGVNTGDEVELLLALAPALSEAGVVGVDHSATALAVARARFPAARFVEADLATLAAHDLGRFDLVVSIGTFQSPGVDDREVLRRVVQDHLTPEGAVILGMPNCRHVDGEILGGARVKNLRQPELGVLVKDVAFYRKYLQQHRRRVFVTGSHYLLITGVV